VRMIMFSLALVLATVVVSTSAQAPSVNIEAKTISRPDGGVGVSLSGVTIRFPDGTQLTAREATSADWADTGRRVVETRNGIVTPRASQREFVLTGEVRLRLPEK
jgi:hypothetical protein